MLRRSDFWRIVGITLLGLVLGALIGTLMALRMNAPPLVGALLCSPLLGVIVPVIWMRVVRDARVARLGTLAEKRRLAALPMGPFVTSAARVAVALEAGDLQSARYKMAQLSAQHQGGPFALLVRLRFDHLVAAPGALEALLAWRIEGLRDAMMNQEARRYHAYVVAKTLAGARDDARRTQAATRLLGERDAEVRAYGTWLTALDDEAMHPPLALDVLAQGTALARHEQLADVAFVLESRIAKRALEGRRGPYRA